MVNTYTIYSRKIWRGGLVVYLCNCQIKMHQYFLLAYIIHMLIPYRTTKFKYTNSFTMVILGPTAKFNSRQYFQLYGMYMTLCRQSKVCYDCYNKALNASSHLLLIFHARDYERSLC